MTNDQYARINALAVVTSHLLNKLEKVTKENENIQEQLGIAIASLKTLSKGEFNSELQS